MTEQKTHLENAISQQKQLISEIDELNRQVTIKRESAIKLQGIIEYLGSLEKNETEKQSVEFSKENEKEL